MVVLSMQSISGNNNGTYTLYMFPLTPRALGLASSERQILDLSKLFFSADQIILYFIQIIVNIRQFCGIDKYLFFLLFSD